MRRNYNNSTKDIPKKILGYFAEEFSYATNIRWTALKEDGICRARFNYQLDMMEAFFDETGNCFKLLHYLASMEQVSVNARKSLETKLPGYRLIPIYECLHDRGTSYTVLALGTEDSLQVQVSIYGDLICVIRTSAMKHC